MKELRCAICGMIINSRNVNINRYSFIEENTENRINSCPFCGVVRSWLLDEEVMISANGSSLSAESIRILDNAMKLEVFNSEFYKEASGLAKSEEVSRMFRDLSSIELTHARIHMRLGGFDNLPKLHKPDYSRHSTDELLLSEAAKRENHAVQFYERNSGKISSAAVREVFKALSEVEEQHIHIVGRGDDFLVPQSRVTSH